MLVPWMEPWYSVPKSMGRIMLTQILPMVAELPKRAPAKTIHSVDVQ
jgi:hypothetical protein